MTAKLATLPELNRRAYAILSRELGVIDTLRFFGQLGLSAGNYTEERRQLFADLTLEGYRAGLAKSKSSSRTADQE
jgi:hypothetical protein